MKIWKLLPFLMLLLLTACRSSKVDSDDASSAKKNRTEEVYKEKVMANAQQADAVTAKVGVSLNAMGKEVSASGRLRMKRNEVVQLSLSLLGFEVGRMEFTPEYVLIIDRINKQFVRANYTDVSFLQQADLDFYTLQSLFWNELFIPGERNVNAHLSRFKYNEVGNTVLLSLADTPKLVYTFQTQTEQAVVNHVTVKGKHASDKIRLEWSYDKFVQLDNRYFPSLMGFRVEGLDKPIGLTLSLSRLSNDNRWASHTNVSPRYRERQVEDILQQLMSM